MENTSNSNQHELTYDANTGELYKIWLVSLLLTIITFGIYRFWGKTRIRRYLARGFSLGSDRFEYTGQGGELFRGFIKAIIFLFIISLPFIWAHYQIDLYEQRLFELGYSQEDLDENELQSFLEENPKFREFYEKLSSEDEDNPEPEPEINLQQQMPDHDFDRFEDDGTKPAKTTAQIIAVLIIPLYYIFYFIFIPYLAVYSAFRYFSSRLRWRGVRGGLLGSAWKYALMGTLHWLHIILTLGLTKPVADNHLIKYKFNHMHFGSEKAKCSPNVGPLLLVHIITGYVIPFIIIVFMVALIFDFSSLLVAGAASDAMSDELITGAFIGYLLVFLCIPLLFIVRVWYKAAIVRHRFNYLKIGNISFKSTVGGWRLLRLYTGNLMIIIFTLGLGAPLVINRDMRFLQKHTQIIGDLEKAEFMQAEDTLDTSGEGLMAALDIDFGVF